MVKSGKRKPGILKMYQSWCQTLTRKIGWELFSLGV